jgi:YegS/Rv2252/BmrU family lipid kinase
VNEVLIFANPIAGKGRGERIARQIAQRATQARLHARTIFDRADSLDPSQIKSAHPKAAVVIGGDGTLRTVCDSLVRILGPERVPPIAVVPMGTANLMGRHLDIDWRDRNVDQRVVDAIVAGRVTQLDVAKANDRLFLLMVGVGIDAHIVHELDRLREGPIDLTSYILPAALAFQAYAFPPISVSVDGKNIFPSGRAMAFVGNVAEYGTGFPVLTQARSDDGLLDICVLPCSSRQEMLKMALLVVAGEHLEAEGVIYTKGKRVRIDAPDPVPVQIDGDPAGHTPLVIELLPFRLPFIVPAR